MKTIAMATLVLSLASTAFADEDLVSAVHGTVVGINEGTKILIVKTADGTSHSLHVADKTAVHGAELPAHGTSDSWHGLSSGSQVIAHFTKHGTEDTAVEIDRVGMDGLKTSKGTIADIDRDGKKLVVDSGDGTKMTFDLTDHASEDAGKGIAKGTVKGSKVTVYYTEDAGKKLAHFFDAL